MSTARPCPGVVFVAGDRRRAARWAARLATRHGWAWPGQPSGVDTAVGRWLAGFDLGGGTAGLSALVDERQFVAALHELCTAIYRRAAETATAGVVVDVVDDRVGVDAVRRVYPHAVVVAPGEEPATVPSAPGVGVAHTSARHDAGAGLVIVVSSGRSGSTWLHRLLTAHPAMAGTADGETWVFAGAGHFWREWQDGTLSAWVDEVTLTAVIGACCDRLFAAGRSRLRPYATHLCEKTPAHVWQLPMLQQIYPAAAYVHLLRDGRDVALSLSRVDGVGVDVAAAASTWADAVRAVRDASVHLRRYREVRYEDLLEDPVGVVSDVLVWIGLDPDEEFVDEARRRERERVSPLASRGPIGTGKWRSLDAASVAAIDAVAGDLLVELGYG